MMFTAKQKRKIKRIIEAVLLGLFFIGLSVDWVGLMENTLEKIYNIPEYIGWIIVGIMAIFCTVLIIKIVNTAIDMYIEYKED